MKAADTFQYPTTAPNQLWQTDFTDLKMTGWGWFYLSTVRDDYSRYILAWRLCDGMAAKDVSDTLELALKVSGLESVNVKHRPRRLSDNGPGPKEQNQKENDGKTASAILPAESCMTTNLMRRNSLKSGRLMSGIP